ncbi:hypothetical protein B0O99DRAFT_685505 [Bisporella sp. PMI_857]|nr:hypothetical protein B0O99DRAFT_685505 [Bisporella sp. PMI_857]
MRSLFLLLPLLGRALGTDAAKQLDAKVPIYLGDAFWPPTMTFLAWLPEENTEIRPEPQAQVSVQSADDSDESDDLYPHWCNTAVDVSEGSFSLNGIDNLKMHDYFEDKAHITRDGERFADCFVTPESTRVGVCKRGHKFAGPATRRWTCWTT